jgi:glycerophosphoryl diester phosphodiesterase
MGADGVELDVRLTEGRLLVHHDPVPDPVPPWVPTLEEALDICPGVVNVEIKNLPTEPGWDPAEAVVGEVVPLVVPLAGRVIVSAFTLTTIDAVRALDPSVPTGWLTPGGFDQLRAIDTATERGHTALHPHHSAVTAAVVDAAHTAGLALNTWTVDDPDRMRELAALGVDAIITNVPDVAVATLRP